LQFLIMPTPFYRRDFLKSASLASMSTLGFPAVLRAQSGRSPNSKLNVAFVGVGGRGRAAVRELADENRVAFCDVDEARAASTFAQLPNVPRFRDYRVMFDRMAREIDAVRISTPDHMHYPVALAALSFGKHVYVEKPLTHTIWEARQLAKLALESKVATQMGNQGHANEGVRLLKEWHQAGILGEVTEVVSWTNRPTWPQGLAEPDHSKFIPVKPSTTDWDLWLGIAPDRPYDPAFAPHSWRGFWDYGCGALGDMACHIMDGAYSALDLGAPEWVEAVSRGATLVGAPTASMVTYQFPAREKRPPVSYTWYDGDIKPVAPEALESHRKLPDNGTLIVGSKATVLADLYYSSVRVIPEAKMQELVPVLPSKSLPRSRGHCNEWVDACKGGAPALSNFAYSAPFSEVVLLGNIAIRVGRRLKWDAAAMTFTNSSEANRLLTKEYRPGFGV